ncbi:MAG TPA: GNAT family N-acetyltransferase [Gemmatimonadaceae bacterium]|jgi:RimJ/RimL family protein N-acetyltransferase|nr:GNAT family N-acetyltransferase [Gemmatimonadaceae bacterium]
MSNVILETKRLRLRELAPTDLDFVASMLGDADVMRYYPRRLDRAGAQVWMERQQMRYERDGHGLWLVLDRETGEPIGQVGLVTQELKGLPRPTYPEIGYLLHRSYWHRGFATEAALAVRDYAFHTRGYDQVISLIRAVNQPSQAVARRLGMSIIAETEFAGTPHLVFGLSAASMKP